MMETAISTLILTETGKVISKIQGRRNYVIRIETIDKIAYVGGMGIMQARNFTSEYLWYIKNHGTTWAYYTYKKDCLNTIKVLEKNGFVIRWIS